jgi:tetratricopeptide (TPR) repeat protein
MSQVVDSLAAAREAASRHAWREAYAAYAGLDGQDLTAEDLERYAEAAWWLGKLDEAIRLRERSHAGFVSAGEKLKAARVALILSWDYSGRGAFSVSHGWFATAERMLEEEPESAEHGLLVLTRAVDAMFGAGRLADAISDFERAFELARRYGDRDTQVLALSGKGRALVKSGEIEQGLALLDEATAAAVSGEVKPYSTGLVYCITISSCQDLGDYRRAAEWTEAANQWCDRLDVTGESGAGGM